MGSPVVVIFARALVRGRVKTRLAATMGDDAALDVYRTLAERVVRAVTSLEEAEVIVRCAPDESAPSVAEWLEVRAEGQGEGDLGARMQRAVEDHLALGAPAVLIVGTDAPDIDAPLLRRALDALAQHDVVFGPALDGGYYLVGARRAVPEVFRDVPWSSDRTLAVSLERARQAGYLVALLEPLTDIDTEADWRAWQARQPSAKAP